jgi:hypothetical protein
LQVTRGGLVEQDAKGAIGIAIGIDTTAIDTSTAIDTGTGTGIDTGIAGR